VIFQADARFFNLPEVLGLGSELVVQAFTKASKRKRNVKIFFISIYVNQIVIEISR